MDDTSRLGRQVHGLLNLLRRSLCTCLLLLLYVAGEHRVPERLEHAVHRRPVGGHRRGALEPPQAHRSPSPAAGRRASGPVRKLCDTGYMIGIMYKNIVTIISPDYI